MDAVQTTLRRIRVWFIVWFVAQTAVGIVVSVEVIEQLSRHGFGRWALMGVSAETTAAAGILGALVALLLGLLVIESLLERRRWARIVLLAVGWLTAGGALLGLAGAPVASAFFQVLGGNWLGLQIADVLSDVVDLAFWSWVIYTLQFGSVVPPAFTAACTSSSPPAV